MERLCASCGSPLGGAPIAIRRTEAGEREYMHASGCQAEPEPTPVDSERRLERDQVTSTGTGSGKTPYGSGTVYDAPADGNLHKAISRILKETPDYL
jgi:hypothetical protein